jgi:hypothetical protein
MDDLPWATYALPLGMLAAYYLFYRLRVWRHGAYPSIGQTDAHKWGLREGEEVVRVHYVAETYVGPLSPSGDGEPGAIHIVLTTHGRLVLAKGDERGAMMPFMTFEPDETRPLLVPGQEAFAGDPRLPKAFVGPERVNAYGDAAKLELAQLVTPKGDRYTLWCEPSGLSDLRGWCVGQV